MKKSTAFSILLYSFVALLFIRCDENRLDINVSETAPEIEILNFADAYYGIDSSNFYQAIPALKETYPHFFATGDSMLWVDRRFNEGLSQLFNDHQKVFTSKRLNEIQSEIESGFQHLHCYFPSTPKFTLYTYISNLDFNYPILYIDSIHTGFIGLDLYLGTNHPAYKQLPDYIKRRHNPSFVAPDLFKEIALSKLPAHNDDESLIDDMIYWGLVRYFQEAMMPEIETNILFGFTPEQIQFCHQNEVSIWTYFVENQLLFDTSIDSKRRFIFEAPFSKFYTDVDNQSPGRIGEWIGWRIIHSYMDAHEETSLSDLMSTKDYNALFRDSHYKPIR